MRGGGDGEGARKIDIEDGDLRSGTEMSVDGGCHGPRLRLRAVPDPKWYVVGHEKERVRLSVPSGAGQVGFERIQAAQVRSAPVMGDKAICRD